MAIATAPDQSIERRILHERYRTAVTRARPLQDPDGSISLGNDNSKDYYRWEAIVRRIACAMTGDHVNSDALEEVDEIAAFMWEDLEDRLVAWIEGSRQS